MSEPWMAYSRLLEKKVKDTGGEPASEPNEASDLSTSVRLRFLKIFWSLAFQEAKGQLYLDSYKECNLELFIYDNW